MRKGIIFLALMLTLSFRAADGARMLKRPVKLPQPAPTQPQSPEPLTPPPPAAVESPANPYPTQCPAEGQRISVAVYPVKPAGSEASLASAMTALIASKLSPSPKLRVIEEAMLKAVMERQAMNVSDLCDDTLCQVEIGKLVQAQKLITGDLVKFGSKYILSLKLIDIQTGAMEFATEDKCSCPEDQLDQLVEVAAAKVRNHFCDGVSVPALSPTLGAPANPGTPANLPAISASPDQARLYVHRCENDAAPARTIEPLLDGQPIGTLRVAGCVRKEIEPGRHVLTNVKAFGIGSAAANEYPFQAEPGRNYYWEGCFSKPGYYLQVSEAEARPWALSCREESPASEIRVPTGSGLMKAKKPK